jgi:hypothetical protein
MECFKIMDFEDGKLKTLFHGLNGSRVVRQWVPLYADMKKGVKDGTGKATYTSGWHVLETKEQAMAYLTKFKHLEKKVIVKCRAAGQIWKKKHSPAEGLWLAEIIEIREIVMFSEAIVASLLFPVKPAIKENAKALIDALLDAQATWDAAVIVGVETPAEVAGMGLTKARHKLEKFIDTLIEGAI